MERKQVQVRMLPSAHQALREGAVERGLTLGEFVELMCERCGVWEPAHVSETRQGEV